MTRAYILQPIFPAIDDTIIAMISGVTLFLLPAKESEKDFTLERSCKDAMGNYSLVGAWLLLKDLKYLV